MTKSKKQEMRPTSPENSEVYPSLSYIEGIATITDIYGVLFTRFLEDVFQEASDEEALRADWERVGQDIKDVILQIQNRFQEELKKVSGTAIFDEAALKDMEKNAFELFFDAAARENGNEKTQAST
jgi:hypothetical protein